MKSTLQAILLYLLGINLAFANVSVFFNLDRLNSDQDFFNTESNYLSKIVENLAYQTEKNGESFKLILISGQQKSFEVVDQLNQIDLTDILLQNGTDARADLNSLEYKAQIIEKQLSPSDRAFYFGESSQGDDRVITTLNRKITAIIKDNYLNKFKHHRNFQLKDLPGINYFLHIADILIIKGFEFLDRSLVDDILDDLENNQLFNKEFKVKMQKNLLKRVKKDICNPSKNSSQKRKDCLMKYKEIAKAIWAQYLEALRYFSQY